MRKPLLCLHVPSFRVRLILHSCSERERKNVFSNYLHSNACKAGLADFVGAHNEGGVVHTSVIDEVEYIIDAETSRACATELIPVQH